MILIHYNTIPYTPSLFQSIINNESSKPLGGLWTCPINCKYGWKEHHIDYMDEDISMNGHSIINLKEKAKILIINKQEDIFPFIINNYINFKNIAKIYDAIHVTLKGIRDTKYILNAWDFETVLILNKEIINYDT